MDSYGANTSPMPLSFLCTENAGCSLDLGHNSRGAFRGAHTLIYTIQTEHIQCIFLIQDLFLPDLI